MTVALLLYGPHVRDGGFTIDDWGHAAAAQNSRGSLLRDYWNFPTLRHGLALYIPFTHVVLGPEPGLHIALAVWLSVVTSTLLYAVLRRLAFERHQAGAIALLVFLFPWSDSARFWAVTGHISLAIGLALAGLLVAFRGLDARTAGDFARARWLHCGAIVLYASSLLLYDIAGAAILLAGALYLTRTDRLTAARLWAVDVTAALICIYLSWARANRASLAAPELFQHAREIAQGGAQVITSAIYPIGGPEHRYLLTALIVALASVVSIRVLAPPAADTRHTLDRWFVLAVGGATLAAASWAQYIPADSYYNPASPGVGNRVNVMAACGVVVFLYATLMLLAVSLLCAFPRWRRTTTIAVTGLTAILALGYSHQVRDDQAAWARAQARASDVLEAISAVSPRLPPGSTVYTFGHPGSEQPGISIFGSSWDLDGAVQLTGHDASLSGYPILEGTQMKCFRVGVSPTGDGWVPQSHGARYGTAYFVDVGSRSGVRVDSRDECRSAVSRFMPGPQVRTLR